MILQNIGLINYRNYQEAQLTFSSSINLFVGQNAQGKTNLLEAISMLAMAKSYRAGKEQELIRWQSEYASLHGRVKREHRDISLDLHITKKGKRARVNGIDRKRMTEFVGNLNVVLFSPEDLQLIKGSPAERRRFLDIEISQISPTYLHDITQYAKVMSQRNTVLREMAEQSSKNYDLVAVWDEQLIEYGVRIMERRRHFVQKLQEFASDIHFRISNGLESLLLGYNCSIEMPENTADFSNHARNSFRKELDRCKRQDLARGVTSVGPHRDDVAVRINGYDASTFGSQGQQRSAALSMKLAEIELIRSEVGEYPVLLLDDVLSELDSTRQVQLLRSMGERVQTFLTTTSTYGLENFIDTDTQVYSVDAGCVAERR